MLITHCNKTTTLIMATFTITSEMRSCEACGEKYTETAELSIKKFCADCNKIADDLVQGGYKDDNGVHRRAVKMSDDVLQTPYTSTTGGLLKNGAGACVPDSLEFWATKRHLGVKRVKGKRHIEKTMDEERGVTKDSAPEKQAYHYWVESKNKVFDINPMTQKLCIWNKAEFYFKLSIDETFIAPSYGMFDNELRMFLCKQLPNIPEVRHWICGIKQLNYEEVVKNYTTMLNDQVTPEQRARAEYRAKTEYDSI